MQLVSVLVLAALYTGLPCCCAPELTNATREHRTTPLFPATPCWHTSCEEECKSSTGSFPRKQHIESGYYFKQGVFILACLAMGKLLFRRSAI